MKKLILSFALVTGLALSSFAQDSKYKLSLGGELLGAIGDATEFYSIGYGGSFQAEYKLNEKLNLTASGAYVMLSVSQRYKDIYSPWGVEVENSTFYPVKAGLKYSVYKNIYLAGEAGASISKDKLVRETSFAYSGGVGTSLPISKRSALDLGLRYEAWSLNSSNTYSFVGLRAAYAFGF
ncbi:MAG: hypothetical protein EOO90_05000 [Pedobacter sp.]|nr:MAG: hypothetical protein EOO90_05000 [Pedobacter sp.]